jgi:predicted anti-sigma-YlaC factor YlaD
MNCKGARERITDSLAAGQANLVGGLAIHVQSCEECRTFCAQQGQLFRAMDTGLRAMANEPAPPSLLPGVRARMQETYARRPWFYRLLPVAAILIVAALIGVPMLRRSMQSGGVQVTVIPNRGEDGVAARWPLAEQTEKSVASTAGQAGAVRRSSRPPAGRRPAQATAAPIVVASQESQAIRQLAAAVLQSPAWAEAMVHPAAPRSDQMEPIEPVEIANLEVKALSEENQ